MKRAWIPTIIAGALGLSACGAEVEAPEAEAAPASQGKADTVRPQLTDWENAGSWGDPSGAPGPDWPSSAVMDPPTMCNQVGRLAGQCHIRDPWAPCTFDTAGVVTNGDNYVFQSTLTSSSPYLRYFAFGAGGVRIPYGYETWCHDGTVTTTFIQHPGQEGLSMTVTLPQSRSVAASVTVQNYDTQIIPKGQAALVLERETPNGWLKVARQTNATDLIVQSSGDVLRVAAPGLAGNYRATFSVQGAVRPLFMNILDGRLSAQ